MNTPAELLHHYAVLGLKPGAGREEVERAYAEMMDLYQDDSRAIYGLYQEGELKELRQALQESYQALLQELKGSAATVFQTAAAPPGRSHPPVAAPPLEKKEKVRTDINLDQLDGPMLRRIREQRRATLESLAQETRVREDYLCALEEERPENFPARVYLIGFLKLYLRAMGLDVERGCAAYLANLRRQKQQTS